MVQSICITSSVVPVAPFPRLGEGASHRYLCPSWLVVLLLQCILDGTALEDRPGAFVH